MDGPRLFFTQKKAPKPMTITKLAEKRPRCQNIFYAKLFTGRKSVFGGVSFGMWE
jgi:hypothetical protein